MVLALHLCIAAIATAPMLATPLTRLMGHPEVDVWNHAWGPWWWWERLSAGQWPLETTLLGAPVGGRLWYIDPVGALLSCWLVPLVGVVGAYNAVIFLCALMASVGGRRLALALEAPASAAWLGAVGVGLSPTLLSEVHNGISEAAGLAWGVLCLAATLRAMRQGRLRDWAEAAFWGVLTEIGSFYYALGLAMLLTGVTVVWLLRRPGLRSLIGAALTSAVVAGAGLAVTRAVQWTLADRSRSLIWRDRDSWTMHLNLFEHNAVDPRTFLWPGDFQSVDMSVYGESFRHTSYIGWVILLLALWSRRGLILAALVPLAFSLGPWLYYKGEFVYWHGARVALPFRALLDLLPAGAVGHPQRLGVAGLALLSGLAAVGLGRLPRAALALIGIAAVELLYSSPWPVQRAAVVDVSAARAIAEQAAGLDEAQPIVLDLPADARGMAASRYLYLQTQHGQAIPYRPDVRSNTAGLSPNRAFQALIHPSEDALGRGELPLMLESDPVIWVLLHRDIGDGEKNALTEQILRAWYGEPTEYGDALLWRTRRGLR